MGTALFSGHGWTQDSPRQRPVWDVQLARNAQASSNITIQNQCQQPHIFTVTAQQTPFLQFLAPSTVNVPGNSSYNLPVRFNTSGMNAGQYQGSVVVKCETCRKEKTCKQDQEILPVRLTVLPDSVQPPQSIPTATPTPSPTSTSTTTQTPEPSPTPKPTPSSAMLLPTPTPSPSPSPCCPVSPGTYTVTYLGTLPPPGPANASIATSINDSQDTVGGSWGKFAPPAYASHAFSIYPAAAPLVAKDDLGWPAARWFGFSIFASPAGGIGSLAYGINGSGHVVGNWYVPGFSYPFWFDGIKMHDLPTPPPEAGFLGGSGAAFAVNIHDDVVGVIFSGKPGSPLLGGHAVMWPYEGDHPMVDLNTLLPKGSGWELKAGYGINDAGHIVGKGVLKGATHAFLWLGSGAPIDLGTLGGDVSVAFGLNSSDEVVGYSSVKKAGAFHGFVWKKGVMTDIGTLAPNPNSVAQAINEKGCVVGDVFTGALYKPIFEGGTLAPSSHGVLYSDGVLIDVNTLIPTDSGWELKTANDINDECQIVGAGYYKGSKYMTAYVLTPPGVALTGGPKPVVSKPTTPTPEVEYFTKLKVGAPLTFFVPFPSSIPCCVYVAKSGAPTIEGPVTHKANFYLLDEKDKPGANPYGTSISFSFDPTYITMVTGFKIPPGPKYGYFLFTTKKVTTPVTTSIKVKVIADKAKPGTGGEAETTITFTITPVP
jgi:probable HAF family extracellular repeat protein